MRKLLGGLAAVVVSGAALLPLAADRAGAAPVAAQSAVSIQDTTWMQSNAQTDEAEVAISLLAFARAEHLDTLATAQVTFRNHVVVLADLVKLAKADGVALPKLPNPVQQGQARTLAHIDRGAFDRRWDVDQIAGHLQSIAQTKVEIAKGTNPGVRAFAAYYLPIAEKHLAMAEADLKALNESR